MGNSLSQLNNDNNTDNKKTKNNLVDTIDMIATNYILKQNMIDMLRFTDKDYYNNLILLTSSIMKNNLSSVEIGIINDRITNGNSNFNKNKNTLYFSNKEQLNEITLNNEKKKQLALLYISKFYIKILSIFSAITAVIDPQYVYEDENGLKKYFYLKDFNDYNMIDKKSKHLKINQLDNPVNFVQKRLTILKNRLNNGENINENSENVVINPGQIMCQNSEDDNNLNDDIGIKELEILYYDIFDNETNKWTSRSKEMEELYQKDLLNLYQIFTGKKELPDNIKTFKDIENLEFTKMYRCKNKDYVKDLVVLKSNQLYKNYMKKIEEIQTITVLYKKKLLHILKTIFIENNMNSDTEFIINPELNIDTIINLQKETKNSIFNIYVGCQQKFIEALILYEKMYENQYGILNDSQIKQLNNHINNNKQSIINNIVNTESLNVSPINNNIELNSNLLNKNNNLNYKISPSNNLPKNEANMPPTNEANVPSTIEANIPPTNEANVPPTIEANIPPTNEVNVPPTNEVNVPPTIEANIPSTNETNIPPTNETNIPPTNEANVPPTIEANIPPTNETNIPPTNETNTPTTNEANVPPTIEANTPTTNEANVPPTIETNTPTTNETNTPTTNVNSPQTPIKLNSTQMLYTPQPIYMQQPYITQPYPYISQPQPYITQSQPYINQTQVPSIKNNYKQQNLQSIPADSIPVADSIPELSSKNLNNNSNIPKINSLNTSTNTNATQPSNANANQPPNANQPSNATQPPNANKPLNTNASQPSNANKPLNTNANVNESATNRVNESATNRVNESATNRVNESATNRVNESATNRVNESATNRVNESINANANLPTNNNNINSIEVKELNSKLQSENNKSQTKNSESQKKDTEKVTDTIGDLTKTIQSAFNFGKK